MAQSESEGKSENTQSATDELRRTIARQHAAMALVHYLASEEYGAPPVLHRSFVNVFGMGRVKGIADAVALGWIEQLDRPAAVGDQEGVFVYNVRNTSADELGRLMASVSGETANVVGANTSDNPNSRQEQARQVVQRTSA